MAGFYRSLWECKAAFELRQRAEVAYWMVLPQAGYCTSRCCANGNQCIMIYEFECGSAIKFWHQIKLLVSNCRSKSQTHKLRYSTCSSDALSTRIDMPNALWSAKCPNRKTWRWKYKYITHQGRLKLEFSGTYASCHLYDPNSWLNL